MLKNTYILRILSHTNRCGGEFNDHYEIHQIGQSAPNFPLGKYHIDKLPFARIRLLAESGSAADGTKKAKHFYLRFIYHKSISINKSFYKWLKTW